MGSAAVQLTGDSQLELTAASRRPGALPIGVTIGLPTRTAAILAEAGIVTFEDLAKRSDTEILEIPQIGYAALREIRATLQHLGYAASTPPRAAAPRTALEQELWELTAPAGGEIERGIAMIRFGWDGRLSVEEIRDLYRVKRDALRRIFLAVETQPPPSPQAVHAIRVSLRFLRDHTPIWYEDAERLLATAALARQRVTIEGLLNACRIAAIDPGITLLSTPRVVIIPPQRVEACRVVIRTAHHLAAIRGTATVEEIRSCSETVLRAPVDRKFVRRAVALLSYVQWLDHRLGIIAIHRAPARREPSSESRVSRELRMRRAS